LVGDIRKAIYPSAKTLYPSSLHLCCGGAFGKVKHGIVLGHHRRLFDHPRLHIPEGLTVLRPRKPAFCLVLDAEPIGAKPA
jgi:hypothetical protein